MVIMVPLVVDDILKNTKDFGVIYGNKVNLSSDISPRGFAKIGARFCGERA